jgi:hypothetical protein
VPNEEPVERLGTKSEETEISVYFRIVLKRHAFLLHVRRYTFLIWQQLEIHSRDYVEENITDAICKNKTSRNS